METLDIQLFNKRVLETIAWCNLYLELHKEEDLGTSVLRSVVEKPSLELLHLSSQQRYEFINQVFVSRTQQLKEVVKSELHSSQHLMSDFYTGRLLAFFPNLNMNDGVTKTVSNNYLDYGGYPPWDTWIYYLLDEQIQSNHSHIIAWVPPQFVEVVNDSIEISPDDSLAWLATPKFPLPYIDQLAAANLLI